MEITLEHLKRQAQKRKISNLFFKPDSLLPSELLPAQNSKVTVHGIAFHGKAAPPTLLGGNQRCTSAAERVEEQAARIGVHFDTPPRKFYRDNLRAVRLLRQGDFPHASIAPLAALLFGKALHKAVIMRGESRHPSIFLLVDFLCSIPKGRQIFKLFLRFVAVLV